jgi:hypothetical protein
MFHKKAQWFGATAALLMLATVASPILAAPPSYSVGIDSATAQKDGKLTINGSVSGSDPGKPLGNVTIDLVPPSGAAVRLGSNVAVSPGAKGSFAWSGPIPGNATMLPGSQIRVTASIESSIPVMPMNGTASVADLNVSNAPPAPAGLKIACFSSPTSALASTCPVIFSNGIVYWPFAYVDNRNSIALVGVTQSGQIVSQREVAGVSKVWKVMINDAKQSISFWGQPGSPLTIDWQSGPTVVQWSVANAPPVPAGLKLACMTGPNSPTPHGISDKCPVILDNGNTIWPFAYVDNRVATALVAYSPSGQILNQMELLGTRYTWNVTLNLADQTATFWGQANSKASTNWNLLPLIKLVKVSSVPVIPGGMKLYCPSGANSPTVPVATTCPVIQYKGLNYWPFSYVDNRSSVGLVGYGADNKVVSVQEIRGTRYVWGITSDVTNRNVRINGQGSSSATVAWVDFK